MLPDTIKQNILKHFKIFHHNIKHKSDECEYANDLCEYFERDKSVEQIFMDYRMFDANNDQMDVLYNFDGIDNEIPEYLFQFLEKYPFLQKYVVNSVDKNKEFAWEWQSFCYMTDNAPFELTEPQRYFPFIYINDKINIGLRCDKEDYALCYMSEEETTTLRGSSLLNLLIHSKKELNSSFDMDDNTNGLSYNQILDTLIEQTISCDQKNEI